VQLRADPRKRRLPPPQASTDLRHGLSASRQHEQYRRARTVEQRPGRQPSQQRQATETDDHTTIPERQPTEPSAPDGHNHPVPRPGGCPDTPVPPTGSCSRGGDTPRGFPS
jgi:hypothetical protein